MTGQSEPRRHYEIDQPKAKATIAGDLLLVDGWALIDGRAPSRVEVRVTGGGVTSARIRLPRPDVGAAFPDLVEAGTSGFEARVAVDLPPGAEREVAVQVTFSGHGMAAWTAPTRYVTLHNPDGDSDDADLAADSAAATERVLARVSVPTDPRHVLVFTHSLAIGGGQLWLQELLSGLVTQEGWTATVVTPIDGPLRADCADLGITVHRTSPYRVGDVADYEGHVRELALLARTSGAGVALVNTLGLFGCVDAAKRAGLPTAWVVHESFELADFSYLNWGTAGLAPLLRDRWLRSLADADQLLFVADATREMFLPYSDPRRCRTIRYGTPMAGFGGTVSSRDRALARKRLGIADDTLLALNVGVMEPRKGQAALIAAMDLVRRRYPAVQLAVVGHHPSPFGLAMSDLVQRSDLSDSVRLVPVQRDPTPWLQAADLFVNSSDIESLPRSILEAVCCGIPVVASDVFGAREMIGDGRSGWLFEPNDVDALAVALIRACETPVEQRRDMAAAAYRDLSGWLDPTGYVTDYSEVLTKLLDGPIRAGAR